MFGDQRLRRAWSDRTRTFVLAAFFAVLAAAGCVAVSFVTNLLSKDDTVTPNSHVVVSHRAGPPGEVVVPAATKAPYLRATVCGRRRFADLVLPTDEPVSLLVPELLELLEEPQDLGQVHLATSLGRVLDPSVPLGETDLVDGVRLHLVTAHDLPPAPLVHDLVEVVERSEAPGRWTERNRTTTHAVLGGLIAGRCGRDGVPAVA